MCKIQSCDKKLFSKGMCSMHYFRDKRTGQVDNAREEEIIIEDYEDFWEFVKKEVGIK